MSVSVNVRAFAGKNSKEFVKHYKAVMFCIENQLSYPKETFEFFRGKVGGGDLDDYTPEGILEYIKNGIEVDLITSGEVEYGEGMRIKVSDIPKEVDEIIISMS